MLGHVQGARGIQRCWYLLLRVVANVVASGVEVMVLSFAYRGKETTQ